MNAGVSAAIEGTDFGENLTKGFSNAVIMASLAGVQQAIGDCGEVPERLAPYVDYERMGRNLAVNDVFLIETGFEEVPAFWSH